MSRYYADIQGCRGVATRQGTAKSGIDGHIRGWHIGARVSVQPDHLNPDKDKVIITRTGGSANPSGDTVIAFNQDGITHVCEAVRQFCAGRHEPTY